MKKKKGDIVKAYVIEKTNQYGSTYYNPQLPNNWSVTIWYANFFQHQQECKNQASELIEKSLEKHEKYSEVFPLIDNIKVRELEIKFLN